MRNLQWSGGARRLEFSFWGFCLFVLALGLKRLHHPRAKDEPKGTSSCPGEGRRDEARPGNTHQWFRIREPRRVGVSFSSRRILPASSWALEQKDRKEESKRRCFRGCPVHTGEHNPPKGCCSCFLLNIFENPYRKSAQVNSESSNMLISLALSFIAAENQQGNQWHRAHTGAKWRCSSQARKNRLTVFTCLRILKYQKGFRVPRFLWLFFLPF